jgi:DNA-binding transcriptional LysR family regulator
MDQLLALRTFVRIVEAGTFAKAADQLNLPRSTASKLIADLEASLGTKLIQRTTRKVAVTPEGAAYYERSNRLIAELEDMNAAVRLNQAQPKGRLRIDIVSQLANCVLIPALPQFRDLYPDIELYLGISDRPVDLIGEGVDCVIRGGELGDTSLIARKIGELDYVTCASARYIERHGIPKHPSDLDRGHVNLNYFSSLTSKPFPMLFHRSGEEIETRGGAQVAVNEITAHLTAIKAGLGIGQTFGVMAQPFIEDGSLIPLLTDWTRPLHPLHVVYPPNRHLNAKLRIFVDWVSEVFKARGSTQEN